MTPWRPSWVAGSVLSRGEWQVAQWDWSAVAVAENTLSKGEHEAVTICLAVRKKKSGKWDDSATLWAGWKILFSFKFLMISSRVFLRTQVCVCVCVCVNARTGCVHCQLGTGSLLLATAGFVLLSRWVGTSRLPVTCWWQDSTFIAYLRRVKMCVCVHAHVQMSVWSRPHDFLRKRRGKEEKLWQRFWERCSESHDFLGSCPRSFPSDEHAHGVQHM